jgi:D-erythro-7,8-dihydroneopterin triphosphate epimerase
VRTIIGFNDWELTKKQDIIITIEIDFDPTAAMQTDAVEDTVNYKQIKRNVIELVEDSGFNLLEKLTHAIIQKIMENPKVCAARVTVDKPHALRFTDSVAVTMSAERKS